MSCLDCESAVACECCERCPSHCIASLGCVYKPFGALDAVAAVLERLDWNITYGPAQQEAKPERLRCYGCARELCDELDAYYGPDQYWGHFCSPCREKRMGRQ